MFNPIQKHLKIMKKIVWLLMSTMALSLAISCNKDNSNDSDIIGTWKLYLSESYCWERDGTVAWENSYPQDENEPLYLVFENNRQGEIREYYDFQWYKTPFTYSLNGDTFFYTLHREGEPAYSVSAQIVKLTSDELVFKVINNFDDGAVEHEYEYFKRVE